MFNCVNTATAIGAPEGIPTTGRRWLLARGSLCMSAGHTPHANRIFIYFSCAKNWMTLHCKELTERNRRKVKLWDSRRPIGYVLRRWSAICLRLVRWYWFGFLLPNLINTVICNVCAAALLIMQAQFEAVRGIRFHFRSNNDSIVCIFK